MKIINSCRPTCKACSLGFCVLLSMTNALLCQSLVRENTKGHTNDEHKAVFLSQYPLPFVNRHKHCLSCILSSSPSQQLSLNTVLFSAEKWHSWRRVCVPHWWGELLGLRQDRHVEWPEVKTQIRQLFVPLFRLSLEMGNAPSCQHMASASCQSWYSHSPTIVTQPALWSPKEKAFAPLALCRTWLQNECLDTRRDFVLCNQHITTEFSSGGVFRAFS